MVVTEQPVTERESSRNRRVPGCVVSAGPGSGDADRGWHRTVSLIIDRSRAKQAKVRFVWTQSEPVGQLSVVGSFNDWTPGLDELVDNPDGTRSVTVGLPYGMLVVFRYLGPDGQWFDEPDADRITEQGSVLEALTRDRSKPLDN
jgi:hypothetical protein